MQTKKLKHPPLPQSKVLKEHRILATGSSNQLSSPVVANPLPQHSITALPPDLQKPWPGHPRAHYVWYTAWGCFQAPQCVDLEETSKKDSKVHTVWLICLISEPQQRLNPKGQLRTELKARYGNPDLLCCFPCTRPGAAPVMLTPTAEPSLVFMWRLPEPRPPGIMACHVMGKYPRRVSGKDVFTHAQDC